MYDTTKVCKYILFFVALCGLGSIAIKSILDNNIYGKLISIMAILVMIIMFFFCYRCSRELVIEEDVHIDAYSPDTREYVKKEVKRELKEKELSEVIVDGNEDCCICMKEMSGKKMYNLRCKHKFCGECVDEWTADKGKNHEKCPVCREKIEYVVELPN